MAKDRQTKLDIAGDTMLDLGKLTFAGLVLAGIFDTSLNTIILVTSALIFSIVLIIIGIYLKTKK